MKKILIAAISAASVLLSTTAIGQDEPALPKFSPIETFTCTYNEGMGPKDLDKATAAWNKWMDANKVGDYWAATVVPYYFGPDAFDFGWIGAWSSGTAMGQGTDMWTTKGTEHAAKFAAVGDCNTHSGFAASMTRDPGGEGSSDSLVLEFTDCNITTDDPNADLFGKFGQWADFAKERGYKGGSWVLFPTYGAGGAEFDFKMIRGYDNFAEMGANWDLYASGDYIKANEINDGNWECDDARVYIATVRRRMAEED